MRATRIAAGEADSMIGCDLVVAAGDEALSKLTPGRSVAVTGTTVVPTSEFSKNPDWSLSGAEQFERLTRTLGDKAVDLDAQDLAEKIMGDRVYANMLLMGASWQQGGIPLSLEAIHHAIELNGIGVEKNMQAFDLGRMAIADPEATKRLGGDTSPIQLDQYREISVEDFVTRHKADLTDYENAALATKYADMVAKVADANLGDAATMAVARGYYKLLAVKNEWEVARLYMKPSFRKNLEEAFDGELDLNFYFGAWPYGGVDPNTGKVVKGAVKGKTALRFFKLMSGLRFLRSPVVDPFRNNDEAKLARRLLAEYEADIEFALGQATNANRAQITELLNLPDQIRGYGHVRERHAKEVEAKRAALGADVINGQAQAA